MVSCCLSQIFPALTHMPCMLSALCCSFVESSLEVLVSSTMGKGGVEMSCLHSSESAGSVLMAEWAGSSWGHSLMSICRQHINRQWNSGQAEVSSGSGLRWAEGSSQHVAAMGCPVFRMQSKATRQPKSKYPRLQARHRVTISARNRVWIGWKNSHFAVLENRLCPPP